MTQLLETLVSPSRGGTESGEGVTTNKLQGWQSIGLKKAIPGNDEGNSVPYEPQSQLGTSPPFLALKRMGFCWLCRRGSLVVKSVHLLIAAQHVILFPRLA